jgi:hypothetical protein
MIKAAGSIQSLYKIGVEGRWNASGPGNKFAMLTGGMWEAAISHNIFFSFWFDQV